MRKLRVFIADGDKEFMNRLVRLVNEQSDMECVGQIVAYEDVQIVHALSPDVLVVDIAMPQDSFEMLRGSLAYATLPIHLLVITNRTEPTYYRNAMAAGALGYVFKRSQDEKFLDAIRCVANGKPYFQAV